MSRHGEGQEQQRCNWIAEFMAREKLPEPARKGIEQHFGRVADWLLTQCERAKPFVLGINGAQGTGKSTLALFLREALQGRDRRVALLSLDDFYLTRAERTQLAKTVHPLLAVRGVPGTHDVRMLRDCVARLKASSHDSVVAWSQFDKAVDDRSHASQAFAGPADIVLLEGWCIGTPAEDPAALEKPLNSLERDKDPDGVWRRFVNTQLETDYADLRRELDALCYLRVPDFAVIRRWRGVQEAKLKASAGAGMTDAELDEFVLHFERVTRIAQARLPSEADCVLDFDLNHCCVASTFRN